MPSIKENIKAYFKKKRLNVFLTFLLLALSFSLLTKLSSDYTKTIVFKLNAINVPEDQVVLIDSSQTLNVTLSTFGFKLIKYYFKTPSISIDFKDLEHNSTQYIWAQKRELSNILSQFDANEKLEAITPDTLWFDYGKNAVKMIPVMLNSDIEYASGFNIVNELALTPDSIRVIGPSTMIDTIQNVQTELLQLTNVNKDISASVNLNLIEDTALKFSNTRAIVNGNVEKFTEGSVDVEVHLINAPDSLKINYYPKTIPVVYSTSLNTYKTISSNSFRIECDFNDLNNEKTYLTPQISRAPVGIKNVKLNIKRVEFIVLE